MALRRRERVAARPRRPVQHLEHRARAGGEPRWHASHRLGRAPRHAGGREAARRPPLDALRGLERRHARVARLLGGRQHGADALSLHRARLRRRHLPGARDGRLRRMPRLLRARRAARPARARGVGGRAELEQRPRGLRRPLLPRHDAHRGRHPGPARSEDHRRRRHHQRPLHGLPHAARSAAARGRRAGGPPAHERSVRRRRGRRGGARAVVRRRARARVPRGGCGVRRRRARRVHRRARRAVLGGAAPAARRPEHHRGRASRARVPRQPSPRLPGRPVPGAPAGDDAEGGVSGAMEPRVADDERLPRGVDRRGLGGAAVPLARFLA